ncbi:MAG: sigma-54 dependent transcriptional regulator [Myxococcota bacterium]
MTIPETPRIQLVDDRDAAARRLSTELPTPNPVQGVSISEVFLEETRDILGASDSIEGLRSKIEKIGTAGRATVLILGESGTGKELVAHRIHRLSQRTGVFVPVNCAMSDGSMVENSLFGHERGAFTDAKTREKGLVEFAHGGTLFLDEVGEMPLDVQAKLLRFLETGTFRRIGGSEEIWVDTRVVAATNRDLRTMVARGTFREDLYFRLNVLPITVPPLRDRDRDVLILAEQFIRRASERLGRPQPQISANARRQLVTHLWPGNVRELKNLMERFVLMQEGLTMDISEFDAVPNASADRVIASVDIPFADAKRRFEYDYFRTLLERHQGNVASVARAAGLDPSNVRRVLRRHDLHAQTFR